MQRLEVSGTVRHIYESLGVKRLIRNGTQPIVEPNENLILKLQHHVTKLIREKGENSCRVPEVLQFLNRH